MSIPIENLTIEEKRELLARVLKKKAHQPASAPLSVYQRRLWFLDQFDPGNAVYNTGKAIRIRGKISIDTAERALNEIIRRHESLRTTFRIDNGEPAQVISPPFPLHINLLDIERLSDTPEAASIEKTVVEELQRPFDISTGPLLRTALLRLGEEEHIAVMAMHHIISDGWSVGVLVREFVVLYDCFSHGRPSPLPELPIQYRDYASWQERTFQDKALPDRVSFWTQHL
ncbi:MAG: condensation domain-containing protein, partial [Bacteroidota bacterium]